MESRDPPIDGGGDDTDSSTFPSPCASSVSSFNPRRRGLWACEIEEIPSSTWLSQATTPASSRAISRSSSGFYQLDDPLGMAVGDLQRFRLLTKTWDPRHSLGSRFNDLEDYGLTSRASTARGASNGDSQYWWDSFVVEMPSTSLAVVVKVGSRQDYRFYRRYPPLAAAKDFERHARRWCRISHPNLVAPFRYRAYPNRELRLAREFLPCPSLDLVLGGARARHDHSWTFRNWPWVLAVVLGVARGVAHLHANDICHGNLNLSNVLLAGDGSHGASVGPAGQSFALVTDFGLANFYSHSGSDAHSDDNRHLSALRPRPSRENDAYAFGVMIMELFVVTAPLSRGNLKDGKWKRTVLQMGKSFLANNRGTEGLDALLCLAGLCTNVKPSQRPHMAEVVRRIQPILTAATGVEELGRVG